jgi:hypothetical protein
MSNFNELFLYQIGKNELEYETLFVTHTRMAYLQFRRKKDFCVLQHSSG